MRKRKKKKDEDFRRLQGYSKASIKCKHCGHTILPTRERLICSYCGKWVYKNSQVEFKYKVLENMKKK